MKKIRHSKGKSKEKKKEREKCSHNRALVTSVRRQQDVVCTVEGGRGRCFWEAVDVGWRPNELLGGGLTRWWAVVIGVTAFSFWLLICGENFVLSARDDRRRDCERERGRSRKTERESRD
jgi:hypothetical protein